jgi:hypothetical protein
LPSTIQEGAKVKTFYIARIIPKQKARQFTLSLISRHQQGTKQGKDPTFSASPISLGRDSLSLPFSLFLPFGKMQIKQERGGPPSHLHHRDQRHSQNQQPSNPFTPSITIELDHILI